MVSLEIWRILLPGWILPRSNSMSWIIMMRWVLGLLFFLSTLHIRFLIFVVWLNNLFSLPCDSFRGMTSTLWNKSVIDELSWRTKKKRWNCAATRSRDLKKVSLLYIGKRDWLFWAKNWSSKVIFFCCSIVLFVLYISMDVQQRWSMMTIFTYFSYIKLMKIIDLISL